MASPKAHNYNFALQKYMLLQEQHEELRSHLDQIRPGLSLTSSATLSSPATSPTRSSSLSSTLSTTSSSSASSRRHSRSSERRHARPQPRRSGWDDAPLDTILDEETLYEISAEEQRLCDVNESIKRALTELLNCDAVRCDQPMRMWVQGRLMETEKELRSGRRRKGSVE